MLIHHRPDDTGCEPSALDGPVREQDGFEIVRCPCVATRLLANSPRNAENGASRTLLNLQIRNEQRGSYLHKSETKKKAQ
jgi:hypothetical protein